MADPHKVYFVKADRVLVNVGIGDTQRLTGLYKYGRATNIEKRMNQIQGQMPFPLIVMKTVELPDKLAARAVEAILGNRLDAYRLKGDGRKREWAAIPDEQVDSALDVLRQVERFSGTKMRNFCQDAPAIVAENIEGKQRQNYFIKAHKLSPMKYLGAVYSLSES